MSEASESFELGNWLQQKREAKGLTVAELSHEAHLPIPIIKDIENGRLKLKTLQPYMLKNIENFFGVIPVEEGKKVEPLIKTLVETQDSSLDAPKGEGGNGPLEPQRPRRPRLPVSSAAESSNIEVVINNLKHKKVIIPNYQRDSDQWSDETKSLFIETVINNLPSPAFFFETLCDSSGALRKYDEVVDGQQRLVTLCEFFDPSILAELESDEFGQEKPPFRLVGVGHAPYLTPDCEAYAGKTYEELPSEYQESFLTYRLSIIKLIELGDLRYEVFRRINKGGVPLSGQDIRLAYFGKHSRSLAFIRVAGVYDLARKSARRFKTNAQKFGIDFPWKDVDAFETWHSIWAEKDIARGQTPSEMFLWSLISAQFDAVDRLIKDQDRLRALNMKRPLGIQDVLDIYCAQVAQEDRDGYEQRRLITFQEMEDKFFPHFQNFVHVLWSRMAVRLSVAKHRTVATLIGATYLQNASVKNITKSQWGRIEDLIVDTSLGENLYGIKWPNSKGRWETQSGYFVQMQAASQIMWKMLQ